MALPTILVNSATGTSNASGATASGAGPSTAITGATATTANNGSAVTARRLELSGSPDLTNVATDGSHVIYFHDTTAGRRRYVAIEGKGGSGTAGAYVDVAVAMGGGTNGVTAAYAIGGKLSSIFSVTAHLIIVENNGSTGDAASDAWTVELESGHDETYSGPANIRCSGSTTLGPFILRGASGAATKPILRNSAAADGIVPRGSYQQFRDFRLLANNAACTDGFDMGGVTDSLHTIERVDIEPGTGTWDYGINNMNAGMEAIGCYINDPDNDGIKLRATHTRIIGCRIRSAGGIGINGVNGMEPLGCVMAHNIIWDSVGDGIYIGTSTSISNRSIVVLNNTLHNNGGDGIEIAVNSEVYGSIVVMNNLVTNSGAYNIHLSYASATLAYANAYNLKIYNNNTYGGTSGNMKLGGETGTASLPISQNDSHLDPSYVNSSAGNFTVTNESLKALGYSTAYGSIPNYVTPGALQVQSPTPSEIAEAVWEYPDRQLTA